MNIKSLLLGSAAALFAVSGARAADAVEVVAEPEPMEYVRVCDTYGTGYFYIPGTETCLRIGGYVRYDIGVGDLDGHEVLDKKDGGLNDTYHKRARLSLRTWTGTETELGTLSTFTETRFQYQDADGNDDVTLNFAWIQLGGFRVGKDESAFTTFTDYAGGVIHDDVIAFGNYDTNLVSYTFDAGNGFSALVALETGEAGTDYEIDSYVPHVVAGVKYAGGWGSAALVAGYDSTWEEFGIKGRVDVKASEQLSLFVMAAYGTTDDDEGIYFNNYKTWAGDWALWAGASYKFSDKATLNVQGAYTDGGDIVDDGGYSLSANVDYELVKDFHIIPEVTYADVDYGTADEDGKFGGFLRFQRNF